MESLWPQVLIILKINFKKSIFYVKTILKNRKLCSLHSQLLLNMMPKSNKYKLNTESQCIAMCYVALDFSRNVKIIKSKLKIEYLIKYFLKLGNVWS